MLTTTVQLLDAFCFVVSRRQRTRVSGFQLTVSRLVSAVPWEEGMADWLSLCPETVSLAALVSTFELKGARAGSPREDMQPRGECATEDCQHLLQTFSHRMLTNSQLEYTDMGCTYVPLKQAPFSARLPDLPHTRTREQQPGPDSSL